MINLFRKLNLGKTDMVILSGAVINVIVITIIFIFWIFYT